jgi:hypothetical protein
MSGKKKIIDAIGAVAKRLGRGAIVVGIRTEVRSIQVLRDAAIS